MKRDQSLDWAVVDQDLGPDLILFKARYDHCQHPESGRVLRRLVQARTAKVAAPVGPPAAKNTGRAAAGAAAEDEVPGEGGGRDRSRSPLKEAGGGATAGAGGDGGGGNAAPGEKSGCGDKGAGRKRG